MHPQREFEPPRGDPQPPAPGRAGLGELGKDLADGGADGFIRVQTNLALLLAPDKADGQAAPEFAARRFVANAAIAARAQYVQLCFAHGALQAQHQPVIEHRRVIWPSPSPISVSVRPARSMRRYHSALLRAKRETSRPSTRPTRASATSAVTREKPGRFAFPPPDRPRSSSMMTIRSAGQPSSRALLASAYCRSVDSRLCSTGPHSTAAHRRLRG